MDGWFDEELQLKKLERDADALAIGYMQWVLSPEELQKHRISYERLGREIQELEATAEQRWKAAKKVEVDKLRYQFMP